MKAKKEFFLKYLNDTDTKKISRSRSVIQKGKNQINSINKKNLTSKKENQNKDKKEKSTFEEFVAQIKNFDYTKTTKWDNEARKYTQNLDKNMNKIKLTELIQINYKNPLILLTKEYTEENYQKILFESEITSIEDKIKIGIINGNNKNNKINSYDIFDNQALYIEKILEKREKLELNKKILNYYLQYYCRNNYELMNPSMNKIRELTKIIDFYYDKIHSKKKEIIIMKSCNIDNTMKLILKKKKFENLYKLYTILKFNILSCYKDIKKLKLKTMNFNYIKYYEENNRLIKEVELIEKNIIKEFNEDNNNKNRIKKFNVIEDIKKKLLRKKEKFNKIYNSEKNSIFDSKKSHITHLYYLFNEENNIQINDTNINNNTNNNQKNNGLFVTEMAKIFKLKLKKIILETVQYYRNKENQDINSIIIFNLNKPKLSDIKNICLEENNLIICFKNIFIKLKNHVDIFLYYYNLICSNEIDTNKYEDFRNEIKSRKNEFYEIVDKNISKLTILLDNTTKKDNILKKNLLIIINLLCLFEKLLKIKFNVKYNKYLNVALKNTLIDIIKYENKKVIDKAMALLPNDIWEKNTLDKSFFNLDAIQERIPFYLRKFISFFNESEIKESLTSKLVNKDNIEDIFNYIINNNDNFIGNNNNDLININFDEVINLYINKDTAENLKKDIESENEIIIFNNPLKYESAYVTNSSCCIIRGIEEQVINLIIFESITYDIFSELFDTIDLYMFISFKMFIKDNKYISDLLKNLNLKEIQKDIGNIDYWSNIITNQKKYMELKKFYIAMEKKFMENFGDNKEFNSDEEKQTFIDKLIPKLNEIFLFDNKKEKNSIQDKDNIENNNDTYKKSNSTKNMKINININGKNINENNDNNNNNEDKNIDEEKNKNNNEEEDDIETLNINQINENTSKSNKTVKDKSEGLNFFNFFRNTNDIEVKNFQEIPIEELIKDIKLKLSSLHIKQIIILISCILTLKKILKRLVLFTTKIELEDQRYLILSKLNKYEKLIEQIQNFFYTNISSEIFDFSQITYLIEEYNWAPTPEEGSTKLFEASDWVNKLKSLFEVIVCEIHNRFNELFGVKKLTQFFINLVKYIINSVQDSFSKIKKCNDMGRSIMLKDIKLLKEGIENTLKKYNYIKNIKTNSLFDILIQYANAWYYNNDELSKFIFNYNIQYKYFEGICNTSPIISGLSSEIKNDFINKVKQNYISQFKKVISNFNKDKY